ncbi:uncharacterized protein LOC118644825 [Monomorium pharaonis]|uniref:uncharacterized protein LOC118644825 n=1 Tax=Monomorium pharaonis TaxID=307658 RepID=UPI0017466C93|nr:uncharacterized protein LOC118644825 [Monomorium pharaonis]XP_036140350.1 uncharacterized protein LOC118644825 [Monomorium pharaonis]
MCPHSDICMLTELIILKRNWYKVQFVLFGLAAGYLTINAVEIYDRMTEKNKKYVIVEFKNGLQIIPMIWLTSDLKRAKWPKNYITNKRYDKAVKNMEKPESTWEEYPIMKIFTSCCLAIFASKCRVVIVATSQDVSRGERERGSKNATR